MMFIDGVIELGAQNGAVSVFMQKTTLSSMKNFRKYLGNVDGK